jgi:hypothetical protein
MPFSFTITEQAWLRSRPKSLGFSTLSHLHIASEATRSSPTLRYCTTISLQGLRKTNKILLRTEDLRAENQNGDILSKKQH